MLVAGRSHECGWGAGNHDGVLLDAIGFVNDYIKDSALDNGIDGGSTITEQDLMR